MKYFHKHVAGPNGACMCLIGTDTAQTGVIVRPIGCQHGANLKTIALVDPDTNSAPNNVSFTIRSPSGKAYSEPGLFEDGTIACGDDGKLVALKIPVAEVGAYQVTITSETDSKFWFLNTDFCDIDCDNSLKNTLNMLMRDPQAAAALGELVGQPEIVKLLKTGDPLPGIDELSWGQCFYCKCAFFAVISAIVLTDAASVEMVAAAAELLVDTAAYLGLAIEMPIAVGIVKQLVGMVLKEASKICCEEVGLC